MSHHASRPVGVVGSDAVAASLRDADVHVETGSVDAVPATDSVVAVGQSAVAAVARVDVGRGGRPFEALVAGFTRFAVVGGLTALEVTVQHQL